MAEPLCAVTASDGTLLAPGLAWYGGGWLKWAMAQPACTAALVLSDIAAFSLSYAFVSLAKAYGAAPLQDGATVHAGVLMTGSAIVFCGLLACFTAYGHYHRRLPFWQELQQVLIAILFAVLFNSSMEFAFKTDASRAVVFGTWLLFPFVLTALRRITRSVLRAAGLWQIRTVVVGDPDLVGQMVKALRSEPELGYAVVETVTPSMAARLPADRRWALLLLQSRAHMLVLAPGIDPGMDHSRNEELVRERVPFAIMSPAEGLPVSGCVQTYFLRHDMMVRSYRDNIAQPFARAVKVAIDLTGAACLLVAALPALLVIAIAVKLDGGPVFYAHPRVGVGRRRFSCLKFRSMSPDSDGLLEHVLQTDPAAAAEWAATQKLRNDPRVTRVGGWLRKTSLDEVPQLLNVLRLEMSLVGPRPIVEAEVRHYGDDIAYYYATRPGLTGLWQVSGRSGTTYRERVQLDTWYVKNWTLWHDIAILAKTVPAVLNRQGAI